MFNKIENSCKNKLRGLKKNNIVQKDIVILSNNCLAGFLYHDYGLKFKSPTINLQILPLDFIKFCNNLEFYLNQELIEIKDKPEKYYDLLNDHDFPVAKLGDITVYFQHYSDFINAKDSWNKRKIRMLELFEKGYKPYIILVSKELDHNVINMFSQLNYDNKLILSDKKLNNEFVFTLSHWGKRDWWEYNNWFSLKRNYEDFDFQNWLKLK